MEKKGGKNGSNNKLTSAPINFHMLQIVKQLLASLI